MTDEENKKRRRKSPIGIRPSSPYAKKGINYILDLLDYLKEIGIDLDLGEAIESPEYGEEKEEEIRKSIGAGKINIGGLNIGQIFDSIGKIVSQAKELQEAGGYELTEEQEERFRNLGLDDEQIEKIRKSGGIGIDYHIKTGGILGDKEVGSGIFGGRFARDLGKSGYKQEEYEPEVIKPEEKEPEVPEKKLFRDVQSQEDRVIAYVELPRSVREKISEEDISTSYDDEVGELVLKAKEYEERIPIEEDDREKLTGGIEKAYSEGMVSVTLPKQKE